MWLDHRLSLEILEVCGRCTMCGSNAEIVTLSQPQVSELGVANAYRVRKHGLEYRLQIAGRAGDYTQDFGSGRLLLHRLLEAGVVLLESPAHLVEAVGKALHLVAGADVDAVVEIAAADARG